MYMEFPRGFKDPGGIDRKAVVLKLHHNLYGQKQAGRVWYEYLCKQLITKAGFVNQNMTNASLSRKSDVCTLY